MSEAQSGEREGTKKVEEGESRRQREKINMREGGRRAE